MGRVGGFEISDIPGRGEGGGLYIKENLDRGPREDYPARG